MINYYYLRCYFSFPILGGEDYVEISPAFEILILDQRSPRGCANVTILDDQIQEGTEDFMVLLFRISNGDIEEPNISEATVTILDDDGEFHAEFLSQSMMYTCTHMSLSPVVTVGFNSSSYEVEEGSETATVCLVKEGETNQPFNVTVTHGLDCEQWSKCLNTNIVYKTGNTSRGNSVVIPAWLS